MTITVATPVLVSAIDGRLMCPFGDLHGFLEAVAGGPLWTHQLPSAMDAIGPHLARQYPWVADLDLPTGTPDGVDVEVFWADVADRLVAEHGATQQVEPMTNFAFTNPIADLVDRLGADRVVPVVVSSDD